MLMSEVVALTRPDTYCWRGRVLNYGRLGGLIINGWHFGDADMSSYNQRAYALPSHLGIRLLRGFKLAAIEFAQPAQPHETLRINCHYFARLMAGTALSLDAPFTVHDGELLTGNLGYGEPGVIGGLNDLPLEEPYHSVVGLGTQTSDCIQEVWGRGRLGICDTRDVLKFMQEFSSSLALFRQTRQY